MSTGPRYRRENAPPPNGPKFHLIRAKANEVFNVSIFGTTVHGFWTHFHVRTEPCTEPRENCEGCKMQWPQRWKGYLHARREDKDQEGFLEVTALVRDKILSAVGGEKFLRGARIKVARGRGDKSALNVMFLRGFHAEYPGSAMPDEQDPEETLRALFSFRRTKSDASGRTA